MNNYGIAPAHDEFEVSVFGPGYGEAIVIHLGNNEWVLIDSCIEPESKEPAALHYLSKIGVPPESIGTIIASHWHDDHIRGLSEVVAKCVNAEFFMSGVFNNTELMSFLLAYSPESGAIQAGGTKEIVKAINTGKKRLNFTYQRISILEKNILGRKVQVSAFSPTQQAQANMLLRLANYIPKIGEPVNHAPDSKPNLSAIVVHVDFGGEAILLGSDLEVHNGIGWEAVVNQAWCTSKQKSSAFKVAHHGSITAHHDGIWTNLLEGKPISMLTPFNRGKALPTEEDKTRIKTKSCAAFVSSIASKKPEMDSAIEKRLQSISKNLSKANAGFGCIRLRKKLTTEWTVELFGRAQQL
jgi:beta-lactamase superfamily II metal-dependent hydrolase